MGCVSSKEGRYDLHGGVGSLTRSSSLPSRRRVVDRITGCGGGYHCQIVTLESSTLQGGIKLDHSIGSRNRGDETANKSQGDHKVDGGGDVLLDICDAKLWSDMIEKRIPKTPTTTPPNEPEVVNVWELMEGLDDGSSPIWEGNCLLDRSFSFHGTLERDDDDQYEDRFEEKDLAFDSTKKTKSATRSPLMCGNLSRWQTMSCDGDESGYSLVKERIQAFQNKIDARRAKARAKKSSTIPQNKVASPPGGGTKVVLYFTSLRGIRKTYEDCCDVHAILRGYGIRIDERDTSMHAVFKEELNEILGPGLGGCTLPRVFAAGKYLGGAKEVREMHEVGKLGKALEECERMSIGRGVDGACELCDDMRFVPCETCSGSCKLYVEEDDDDEEPSPERGEFGGFRRCPDCNENGLVRCPICCSV